jgi:glycosyltransferase involved in cell wall biosynthesis
VRVLTDERLAREFGASAAQLVREEFGWERVAKRFAEICAATVADYRQ